MSSSIPDNIPWDAFTMIYRARRSKGMIHWWKRGGWWYWVALGNCGREGTEQFALDTAKRWIRDRQ